MKAKYNPEPWRILVWAKDVWIKAAGPDDNGWTTVNCEDGSVERATEERIAACVNMCKEIPSEHLEEIITRGLIATTNIWDEFVFNETKPAWLVKALEANKLSKLPQEVANGKQI